MKWYKTADHNDTRHGELLNQVRERLSEDVEKLKKDVLGGGPKVAQRFYGELRQRIIRLPPLDRIPRLSMSELEDLSVVVAGIHSDAKKYGA